MQDRLAIQINDKYIEMVQRSLRIVLLILLNIVRSMRFKNNSSIVCHLILMRVVKP